MKQSSSQHLRDDLRAIYAGKDGKMPDLTRLDRRQGSRLARALVRLVLALGFLSAVAWAGFIAWSRGGIAPARPLVTESDVPDSARSGEEAFYTFRYENGGNAPIASLAAKLSLPPEFVLTSANPPPTDAEALTWTLGSLSRGSDGSITIGGTFRAEVPSVQTLQALYTYRPANFSSDFQDLETARVNVDRSVVETTVDGPKRAVPGDEVSYVINLRNAGVAPAERLLASFVPPEGFNVTSSEPPADEFWSNAWKFDSLAPGELRAITIRGKYAVGTEGARSILARSSFLDETNAEHVQSSASAETEILGGTLTFGLVANGSASDQTANPGDALRVSLDYKNAGTEAVSDVSFALTLSGTGGALPVDWERADLGGARREGNVLAWDSAALPALAGLSPGASGSFDLSLPLLSSLSVAAFSDVVVLSLSASFPDAETGTRTVDAPPTTIRINSDFRAAARAEYFTSDGEPVGSGPLPPTVGETTTYRAVWSVANDLHALKDLRVTATLPSSVAWTGRANADIGTITFDQTTRLVTWTVPALPLSVPSAEASFDVAVTPAEDDAGHFVTLANATSAEATDVATNDRLARGLAALTTELPEDKEAAGKGVVGE